MKRKINKKAETSTGTGISLQTLLGLILSAMALLFLISLSVKIFESYTQSELDVYTMLSADRLIKNIELVQKENIEINDIISSLPNYQIYIFGESGGVIPNANIKVVNSIAITIPSDGTKKETIFKIIPLKGKIKLFLGTDEQKEYILLNLNENSRYNIVSSNFYYTTNIIKKNDVTEIHIDKKECGIKPLNLKNTQQSDPTKPGIKSDTLQLP